MDNALIATGLSFAVTLLTSLFKTVKLNSKQKNLIATGLSLVAGFASVVLGGAELSAGNLASTAIAIYGASQIAYHFILSDTSLNKVLTAKQLFGKDAAAIESVLKTAQTVEKAAAKKSTKKVSKPAKKTTANSKRTVK